MDWVEEEEKGLRLCNWMWIYNGKLWRTAKEKYSFLFIALLSVMIDNTWKSISSKPIIIRLTMSNRFSALKYLVGITCTTSLYYENTLLSIKAKTLVVASLLLSDKSTILPPL